ncbi:ATP-grasp domain-containing protein [Patescibacteria group bacterium]|nr:ATP-grasp domain-containing protein [Patescibacteria group bacterium]MBU0777206.1 ATP-grasp domain-containing protein [Patescibacteria group bacterium]MBU0845901.1 ATP-grasp domain-containing protein [Patescibacteria group bacterium]MBU0922928.1 ATP-grasp domain-containing protein [Patescibacteria group bacterium]MBU1066339.1 ATP-grasp domain-containing protein [Patescibacteria group bacterium]
MSKILVIVGGGTRHIEPFVKEAKELNVPLLTASFSDLEYLTDGGRAILKVKGEDIASFSVVYIRLVGKRFEEVSLLVNHCKQHGVRVVDRVFEREDLIRIPIPKSVEVKLFIEAGIPVPKTYFGKLANIKEKAPKIFGYPFVIKGTTGKQGHAVWSPRNENELDELYEKLQEFQKKKKMNFIAQEFTESSQRSRIFVVGGKVLAGITRPTRWRRRFIDKIDGEFPEGKREQLNPVPEDEAKLAIKAASALQIDIGGVDVLRVDKTGELFVLEVNSAPRWEAVRKDTGLNVEREIIKFLSTL